MFTDLKPYESYRGSGTPWLPAVPGHWRSPRIKTVLAEKNVRGFPEEPLLAATQSRGVIQKDDYGSKTVTAQKDLDLLKLVEVGDFVISLRSFQGGIERAYARGIISPAYTILEAREPADADYLTLLFKSRPFVGALTLNVTGIREGQNIEYPRLARDSLPLPPHDEQAAIVKYLAHAHARIDRAITAKRKLIALLEEQKQAIINQAVTRGLNPGTTAKSTGMPWMASVPSNWEVVPLKRYWTVRDCKHVTVPFAGEGYALASVVQAQRFWLDLSDAKRTSREFFEVLAEGGRKPRRGDLIYCRNVAPGMAAIVRDDVDFAMGQDVCLLRSVTQSPEFLNYFLRSAAMRRQVDLLAIGSTFTRVNVEDLRALTIAVPPRAEQDAIVEHLHEALRSQDSTISRAREEIALLREFRTRLTSDVVTGQVDVRIVAANLPELDQETVFDAEGADEDLLDGIELLADVDA